MSLKNLCSIAIPVAAILNAMPAWATETECCDKLQLSPVLNTSWQNSGGKLEIGVGGRDDNGALQITGQLPLSKDARGVDLVQLDRATIPWLTRVIVERRFGDKGWHTIPFVALDGGLSYDQFGYTPLGVTNKQYVNGVSFNLGARLRLEHYGDYLQTSPQVQLSYARTYTAADKVGIVLPPSEPGLASTVSDRIISPPEVSPQLGVRFGVPLYLNQLRTRFALVPVLAWASSGSDWDPFGKVGRARAEAWLWYHPTDKEGVTNTRIGTALFTDWRVSGSDTRDAQITGILLEYRTGVTIADL